MLAAGFDTTAAGPVTVQMPIRLSANQTWHRGPHGVDFNALLDSDSRFGSPRYSFIMNGPAPSQQGTLFVRASPPNIPDGVVSLGNNNTILVPIFNFTPSVGDVFTIIDNDLSDPVLGTVAGLPEGALFTANGATFRISYVGGTGNDVTATVVSSPAVPLFDAIGLVLLAAAIAVIALRRT